MPPKHKAGGCGCCGCWGCDPILSITLDATAVYGNSCCEFLDGTYVLTEDVCSDILTAPDKQYGPTTSSDPDCFSGCLMGQTTSGVGETDSFYMELCQSNYIGFPAGDGSGETIQCQTWIMTVMDAIVSYEYDDVDGVPTLTVTVEVWYMVYASVSNFPTPCEVRKNKIWKLTDTYRLEVSDCSTVDGATVPHVSRTLAFISTYDSNQDSRDSTTSVFYGPDADEVNGVPTNGIYEGYLEYVFCDPITITVDV